MILWVTDPLVNQNGQTVTYDGATLERTKAGFELGYWSGWDSGAVYLSEEDARALQSVLNEVFPE
jgi:hypothetical protein